ncbi:MAG TPA: trehalase-like domain-containing protein, partial [Thermoanaerobaculia bacterium]|nr:trehalase-like domain-containing protein [Thermoanaerobaculia bacterium]
MAAPQQAEAIADYAAIGDTRSIALISKRGSIDWLCWPRFDAPSIFGRLLDVNKGGHFSIAPSVPFTSKRKYVDGTNVLETTFTCDGGEIKLTDLMPVMTEEEKQRRLTPFRQLLRRVEGVRGEVPVAVDFVPRPDYARVVPRLESRGDSVCCAWGARVMNLRHDAQFDDRGRAELTLRAGERRTFALGYDDHAPAVFLSLDGDDVEKTLAFWKRWSSQLAYKGPYRDMVLRSALVLKLLAYAPSGGIVAAATTSLPEKIGGIRNWDYRYCWLRDASFTVSALYDCGFEREGAAFLDWLIYSTRLTQPSLQ